MKFKLEFDCDNAAFGNDINECCAEIVEILRNLANCLDAGTRVLDPQCGVCIRDTNGNLIGAAQLG